MISVEIHLKVDGIYGVDLWELVLAEFTWI